MDDLCFELISLNTTDAQKLRRGAQSIKINLYNEDAKINDAVNEIKNKRVNRRLVLLRYQPPQETILLGIGIAEYRTEKTNDSINHYIHIFKLTSFSFPIGYMNYTMAMEYMSLSGLVGPMLHLKTLFFNTQDTTLDVINSSIVSQVLKGVVLNYDEIINSISYIIHTPLKEREATHEIGILLQEWDVINSILRSQRFDDAIEPLAKCVYRQLDEEFRYIPLSVLFNKIDWSQYKNTPDGSGFSIYSENPHTHFQNTEGILSPSITIDVGYSKVTIHQISPSDVANVAGVDVIFYDSSKMNFLYIIYVNMIQNLCEIPQDDYLNKTDNLITEILLNTKDYRSNTYDYRLNFTPLYLKLCKTKNFPVNTYMQLKDGYIPIDYANSQNINLLEPQDSHPRKYYSAHPKIPSSLFTWLVHSNLIGLNIFEIDEPKKTIEKIIQITQQYNRTLFVAVS